MWNTFVNSNFFFPRQITGTNLAHHNLDGIVLYYLHPNEAYSYTAKDKTTLFLVKFYGPRERYNFWEHSLRTIPSKGLYFRRKGSGSNFYLFAANFRNYTFVEGLNTIFYKYTGFKKVIFSCFHFYNFKTSISVKMFMHIW